MTYFLDTDICIYVLRGQYPDLAAAFRAVEPARIKVPAIVYAELYLGARKSQHRQIALKAVAAFLDPFEIVDFGRSAAEVYADVREALEASGQLIGPNDLLIAATVLEQQGVLVTHNIREFSRVPGLKCRDWTRGAHEKSNP